MVFCRQCGTELREGRRFCVSCGAPRARPAPSTPEGTPTPSSSGRRLTPPNRTVRSAEPRLEDAALTPPSGGSVLQVLGVCAVVSLVLWVPLSIPSLFLNGLVASKLGIYGLCDALNVRTGSPGMFACSSIVGVVTVALGPVVTTVGLFVVRKQVARLLHRALQSLSGDRAFLVAPIIATAVFLVAWAGVHALTPFAVGLLPNAVFPAIVGVFTFLTVRHGRSVQSSLSWFFRMRDILPKWMRWLGVLAVPTAFAIGITVVFVGSDDLSLRSVREQAIVLVSLVAGYLLLAPREGDPLGTAKQVAAELRARLS